MIFEPNVIRMSNIDEERKKRGETRIHLGYMAALMKIYPGEPLMSFVSTQFIIHISQFRMPFAWRADLIPLMRLFLLLILSLLGMCVI